jgi:serine/threonine protein phosphatase 1
MMFFGKWGCLLAGLFNRFRKSAAEHVVPRVPDGQRIYCIGDIHGCIDLLLSLNEMIRADAAGYGGKKTSVYLGDYIDRGEASRQVIDLLLSRPLMGFEEIFLLGNHEQIMLDFMEYPDATAAWLSVGGREVLNSYGIPLAHIPTAQDARVLAGQLKDSLPESHREFLQNCRHSWQCGSYYFVHAGIRPGLALDEQLPEDQTWIRDEFLHSNRNHGAVIVHGHTVCPQPEVRPNRIGIDTGSFESGILTCLVLEGGQQRFLQTGKRP